MTTNTQALNTHDINDTLDIETLLKDEFDEFYHCNESLFMISKKGLWGMIDVSTNNSKLPYQYITEPKYESVSCFSEELAEVELGELSGYIDMTGQLVIPIQYEQASYFTNGIAQVKLNGKYGYIDNLNQTVIPFEYNSFFGDFMNDLLAAEKEGKYGLINPSGEVLAPFEYDFIQLVGRGMIINRNDKYGFWDNQLNEIIPIKYDQMEVMNKAVELNYMYDSSKMTIDEFRQSRPKPLLNQ